MKIVILTENTVYRREILAEHGLSLIIEKNNKRYLFDTGQSGVFIKNAKTLGEDIEHLDGIILSHGHYDHCGGLEEYAKKYQLPPIYVRKEAFEEKLYQGKPETDPRPIGIPWKKELAEKHLVYTDNLQEIDKNIFVLGNIPMRNEFERVAKEMLVKKNMLCVFDAMIDEQMLIIREGNGLHVFVGCAHAGIINAVSYVEKNFPNEPIISLFAGMHLSQAPKEQVQKTMEELEARKIPLLIPVHCTGLLVISEMKKRFGDTCKIVHAGQKIVLS